MIQDDKLVRQIIKRYGAVLDLKKDPGVIIDVIRSFAHLVAHDDGGLPGGVPPSPPPGPTSIQDPVTNAELMKQLLKLSRSVDKLSKELKSR